ncbi:hypothetical protein DR095_01585 [Mycoplasma flocculare]|uniref:Uncharacterized protein n=1 Tax=Mesomycoplasma flocculare TaxID=2128 RepID=A0AAW9XBI0_MESFC|nr:hypothetical protein [Mesomycoplasma flocculare]MXR39486.1 hypothetical protein [Mycoplasma sp. MF12]ENX50984.1 hypothetical protein MFC_00270 [Mesomycoplasma flocculare ATCC 27716]MXR13522.1 hypothetical protein [Mesomycoplasma flocculare]MXR56082.1 hypothetical protein [Mesomycoplasma flocculare]MXR56721.1 hypothetical protein [Mesomycoplasma flocculare]
MYKLQSLGAQNIIVSNGENGAYYLKTKDAQKSFKLAAAGATETVTVSWLGNQTLIQKYLDNIQISKTNNI